MRTGLTDALATDQADDAYDLSWMSDLPADDLRAIKALRQLLDREADAIDRHYMHAHLQALLYRSRDVFASALDEYDQACHQHDAEMDGIRAAFMAKWGRVPVLETYKQMAIRQQKAKNFDQALWWAERGLTIYGTDCARAEAVADLQKRAASFRAKLNPQPRPPRPSAVRVNLPEVEVLTCSTCGREFSGPGCGVASRSTAQSAATRQHDLEPLFAKARVSPWGAEVGFEPSAGLLRRPRL